MDLQKLRIIRHAASCEFNLTRAAQEMHTSQPGLSRQIRELEEELGVELFIRIGKRLVGMTAPGKELLEIACRILAEVGNIQSIPDRFGKSGTGALRLAADFSAFAPLAKALQRFSKSYPKVRMFVRRQESAAVAAALLHDEADMGIAGEHLRNFRDIVVFPCARLQYKALIPTAHPLAKTARLSLEALAEYPLLTYETGTEERLLLDNAFAVAGIKPDIALCADSPCLADCAALGLGVALVCDPAVGVSAEKRIFVRDVSRLFGTASLFLGVRRGKLFRDFELKFIKLLLPDLDPEVVREVAQSREPASYVPGYAI
ncbi:MAG: LysR family transcriptional regulator [Desulfovibrio sp.]|jgi:LysR family cys regulon transcriptional activator|nr:LysR family transcriptional regulator [Desulfovibrio sp.]